MVDATSAASNKSNSSANLPGGDLAASFRQRANYMKTWKPASTPSNRDRLELYALHKQAVSGDAPAVLSTQTAAERAKFQAWKQKTGMSQLQAMKLYLEESDRQVRVYGTTTPALTPENSPMVNQSDGNANSNGGTPATGGGGQPQQPRGLAAIPLLCAAASESRQAYLRRLVNTRLEQAWWSRQEPLCATPGTFLALPEKIVLTLASALEYISLVVNVHPDPHTGQMSSSVLPAPVIQSFLWPAHNSLLALWMGVILVATTWTAAFQLTSTLLWGSRRTGHSLSAIWKDAILLSANSIHALTEKHQPLTARLTGMLLLPFTVLVAMTNSIGGGSNPQTPSGVSPAVIWTSLLYCACMGSTWWYWFLTLPWLATCLLTCAFIAGGCFAMIEIAGV